MDIRLSLFLIIVAFVFAFVLFALADPFGTYQVNSLIKPVPKEPTVFKEKPLVFVDTPVVASQSVNTHVEETVETANNEFDECVAECKANNVSSSVIDFCIRENCVRLK